MASCPLIDKGNLAVYSEQAASQNTSLPNVSKPSVFCDSALRSDCIAGVWVVDCIARQGYKVSVMARPASAENEYGTKLLKTLSVWAYQGKVTCE